MILSIDSAQVCYKSYTAFSDFSLQVAPGEMVSIIGKSGCGKTSLLYAIAGLVPTNSGTIDLEGGTKQCSLMFQQDRLLPWKRVIDNIIVGLSKDQKAEAEELLELMGLSEKTYSYPNQLSGGERQRVALMRSLIRRPRLLLLDEPFASLDEQTREHLQDEVKAYVRSHHMTMILVTHSILEAVFMGERIAVMTKRGISYETVNPYHDLKDLRLRPEPFILEQTLREKLGGNV